MKVRSLILLALGACTISRPEGAYRPNWDAGDPCAPIDGVPSPCGDDGGVNIADDDVPTDDGNTDDEPGLDAGAEPDAPPVDPLNPLSAVGGRYLMRLDYYSTAVGTDLTTRTTLRVKNRVSNLFLVTLTAGDGELQATEQLCVQSSQHQCLESCADPWTTTYDVDLPKLYAAKSTVERVWKLDPASRLLTVPRAYLPLGFDPNPGDPEYRLPADISAQNVWQPGTTMSAVQRGLHTYVTATLKTPLGNMRLSCNINSAMVFATAFGGTLGALSADGLANFVARVEIDGQTATVLDAEGSPKQACDPSALRMGGGSMESTYVRFQRTTRTTCPSTAAVFERDFPPPAGTELDPPEL